MNESFWDAQNVEFRTCANFVKKKTLFRGNLKFKGIGPSGEGCSAVPVSRPPTKKEVKGDGYPIEKLQNTFLRVVPSMRATPSCGAHYRGYIPPIMCSTAWRGTHGGHHPQESILELFYRVPIPLHFLLSWGAAHGHRRTPLPRGPNPLKF